MLMIEMFHVEAVETARVVDLTLPVSLDSEEFDRINQYLLELIVKDPTAHWILDLSRLSYMGSAALGMLVNVRQQIKQGGGQLMLCGMSQRLHQIFRTCCMERLFVIRPNRADALRVAGVR